MCKRAKALGRCLIARGPRRPGRFPTRTWAITLNNAAISSGASERNCLRELLRKLLDFPERGSERTDIRAGIRSFPCGNYLVFYWPEPDGITVVRIVYGGRDLEIIEYPLQ